MEMFSPLWGKVSKEQLRLMVQRMKNEKPHLFGDQVRLNSFFPPFPSPAFDRFFDAATKGRRVPMSLYLAVTDRCPFRCSHCSYAGREVGRMSHEKMLDVLDQIKRLGTCTIGFTGGEPLLRPDLEDFIAAAGPEMATVVFTTGYSLTAERAKRIADSGVTVVTIGVESTKPEEHDAVRCFPGSFEIARQAIAMLNEAGVYTAISTVGKRERIESGELERLYELGRSWGAKEFRIIPPVATGAMADRPESMLSAEEYQYLSDFHIQHNTAAGDGPVIAGFAYLESEQMFGCGAGYHHVFIDANGDVCPCDLTPMSFGNLMEESLAEVWDRMEPYFSKPRCGCVMGEIARSGKLTGCEKFPLSPAESMMVCPKRNPGDPLPDGYRMLMKD
jgi:MoaA/NifB/PqqE/SkfB family radical SAM enzyme